MVFQFLTRVVEELDTPEISQGQAFAPIPHLLTGIFAAQFRAMAKRADSGGMACWPQAVQNFLRTYATSAAMPTAVTDFRNIRQQST